MRLKFHCNACMTSAIIEDYDNPVLEGDDDPVEVCFYCMAVDIDVVEETE